jgi:acyl-coenzyme A thioesterase PaaI-like protein
MIDILVEDGPWQGWYLWPAEPDGRFFDRLGDVYFRHDGEQVLSVMETGFQHTNPGDRLHGGFLMAFIDISMFLTLGRQIGFHNAVTLQCSTDFLSPGLPGRRIESRGRVVKETGRLIWLAGTLTQDDGAASVCQWHGIMRKFSSRP